MPDRQHEHEADGLQRERDDHGQLAPDAIGRPAPEDPAAAVGERVERRRRRPAPPRECPTTRHRPGVGGHEQAAGRHHHEHRVEHVELRRAQHLAGRVLMLAQLRRPVAEAAAFAGAAARGG